MCKIDLLQNEHGGNKTVYDKILAAVAEMKLGRT
jgi:hypothetical protein